MISGFFRQAELMNNARYVLQRYRQTDDTDYVVQFLLDLNPKYDAEKLHRMINKSDVKVLLDYLVAGLDM